MEKDTPPDASGGTPVSVVIAAYTMDRLALLDRAIASALAQGNDVDVVLGVDNNEELLEVAKTRYPQVRAVLNTGPRGASAARNVAAKIVRHKFIAFLDDDAEAMPGWLEHLVKPLVDDPTIVGTGGWVDPDWSVGQPRWFPMEFGWVIGVNYTGLPEAAAEVRNVWSENMAVRADDFWAAGGFRDGFGKVGQQSISIDDTELCVRMAAVHPGSRWWMVPGAVIRHHVGAERSTFKFFLRRCYVEGAGKARLVTLAGSGPGLSAERDYVRRVLPRAVLRGLGRGLTGNVAGLLQAGAIVLGLVQAGRGFVRERIVERFEKEPAG